MFKSSNQQVVYADYNATAPVRPEAKAAMLDAMEIGANASSVHAQGRKARAVIEDARDKVAAAIGACRDDVVFTSGATEASAIAFHSLRYHHDDQLGVIMSAVEHPAIRQQTGFVIQAGMHADGTLDLDGLRQAVDHVRDEGQLPCLALMLANNETGVIQPVEEATAIVHEAGGVVVCDAVQALGKIPVSVVDLEVDYLIVSAHKFGGPSGVGAIYARGGAQVASPVRGGGQERMRRPGTENLIGVAGFGAAAEAATAQLEDMARLAEGRDRMEARLAKSADITIFGMDAPRVAQTSCFAIADFRSETQIMALDLEGVAASAGSACSSGKVRRSEVLSAMGAPDELAECAIRLSFGWATKDDDFDRVAEAWLKVARRAGLPVRDVEENA